MEDEKGAGLMATRMREGGRKREMGRRGRETSGGFS